MLLLLYCFILSIQYQIIFATTTATPSLKTPPPSGNATLTHYDLPFNFVASCGCVGLSTRYPTAAMNSLSYGSSNSYGPQCGVCYKLTLLSTPFTPPPPKGTGKIFSLDNSLGPSVVVKITDACPLGGDWCTQTTKNPKNSLGSEIHFDLAWPSLGIKKDFFPTDDGRDYGAWWAHYDLVDCVQWAGYNDPESWGSDWNQESSACCPLNPGISDEISNATSEEVPSYKSTVDTYDEQANIRHCPSYTDQIAAGLTYSQMIAQVPNTSNILSRKKAGYINGASLNTPSFGLSWRWLFMSEQDTPTSALHDWNAISSSQ